jgi:hypothetical protein
VNRKPSLAALLVFAVTPALTLSQQIPVKCSVPHDVPVPPRPAGPHDAKPVTEAEALEIDKAGRSQPGFLSMPEPENFGLLRYRLAEYAACADRSHCYWSDLQSQLDRASAELKRLVATRKRNEKLAMVLDIDETSLSSYCVLLREGFANSPAHYAEWLTSPDASIAIPGTLALYNQALADNVSVFFITGRSHELTGATARNLRLAGYDHWSGLILRSEEELTTDTTWYKSSHRAEIAKDYRIVLSVGDQWSDLNGTPHAEVSVKLPNPFYFLP